MTDAQRKMLRMVGAKEADTKPKTAVTAVTTQKTEYVTREEFNLLHVTDSNTVYYITETDGTVTVRKGQD